MGGALLDECTRSFKSIAALQHRTYRGVASLKTRSRTEGTITRPTDHAMHRMLSAVRASIIGAASL